MKKILFVFGLLCMAAAAQANYGPYGGIPGDVAPMKRPTTVRMVRERIDIKANWDAAYKVHCLFVFKNEGPATRINMGFPECGDDEEDKKTEFASFNAWVDGQPVKSIFIPGKRPYTSLDDNYINWHVHTVHFDANQTRTVSCEYYAPLEPYGLFTYILRTGRDWKGNIGETVVVLDATACKSYTYAHGSPHSGLTAKDGVLTWRFTNFKPTKDINIWVEQKRMVFFEDSAYFREGTADPRISQSTENLQEAQFRIADLPMYGRTGVIMADADELYDQLVASAKGEQPDGETSSRVNAASKGRTTFTFALGARRLAVRLHSKKAILNGTKRVYLDHAPYRLKDGSMIVPLFSVVKALGCKVKEDVKRHRFFVKTS